MVKKYFLAIVIPEPFQTEIMGLKQYVSDNFKSKGALRSPAHITLHMPFEWKEEKEEDLIQKLKMFTFNEPFSIQLKNFSSFPPRVIFVDVVPNNALNEFQKALVTHAKQNLHLFNQSNDMRGFHPHVTIAFRDLKKATFLQAWEHFKDKEFNASFNLKSFFLLKQNDNLWEAYHEFIPVK